MLRELTSLPPGLLEAKADELHHLLGGPSLIHLQGQRTPPLFLSILLHGDETTGFEAVQHLLRDLNVEKHPDALSRSLSIFIGNTAAAHRHRRRLEEQPDFNRIWSGDLYGDCAEQRMVERVITVMKERDVFASVDIHNNTGRNPHYGCVNVIEPKTLALAGLFSNTVVYFRSPAEVQSMAFSEFCTAVTVECGQAGEADGVAHAADYLKRLMTLDSLDNITIDPTPAVYHTTAVVKVPRDCTFAFEEIGEPTDITINRELEDRNFEVLQPGTHFATVANGCGSLMVIDDDGQDVAESFFDIQESDLVVNRPVVLSMFTTNTTAVRQDCLCYFMEDYPL